MKIGHLRRVILGLVTISILVFGSLLLIAQDADDDIELTKPGDTPYDNKKGADQELVTFILDDFEKSGAWVAEMPRDQGVIFSMRRKGVPTLLKRINKITEIISNQNQNYLMKKATQYEESEVYPDNPLAGFPYRDNKYVLGVRVEFMKRGYNWFTVKPPMPIKIPGITKQISVQVVGRGFRHWLWIMIRDYSGNRRYLSAMRPLTHKGWRRIIFPIPSDIRQEDYKVTDPKRVGLTFDGFLVHCDPLESRGKYYIYFDLLTADVNLYFEFEDRDSDDMKDFW